MVSCKVANYKPSEALTGAGGPTFEKGQQVAVGKSPHSSLPRVSPQLGLNVLNTAQLALP